MTLNSSLQKAITFCSIFFLVTFSTHGQQWGDYTLYSVMGNGSAYLIDTNNAVYHTWALGTNYRTGYSAYLEPGGMLVKSIQNTGNQFTGGPITGAVIKADWNGNITWNYVYST